VRRYPLVAIGVAIFALVVAMTIAAPWLATHDPQEIAPTARLRAPSLEHLLGTDALGRDIWSRTLYGGRISLVVGFTVAALASALGLAIGLVSGYSRIADALVMRIMDGLMSIPAILLAIALTLAPLIVQTTYVCAAAMLIESVLSFLGAGTPPEVPSWGNIMAEGRTFFQIAPWLILSPGLLLGLTVLSINMLGDGLGGILDPRIARRM
jgi:peptide/nickel transport system permease protein